jgi:hypothetical protein
MGDAVKNSLTAFLNTLDSVMPTFLQRAANAFLTALGSKVLA